MDQELKQRLIGASVIIALAIIFVPMMFDGNVSKPQQEKISISIPEENENNLEVKTFDLDKPVTDKVDLPASEPPPAEVELAVVDDQPALIEVEKPEPTETEDPRNYTHGDPKQVAEVAPAEQISESASEQNQTTPPESKPTVVAESRPPVQTQPDLKSVAQPPAHVEERRPKPVVTAAQAYRVKLGSFSQQANAERVKNQLIQNNMPAVVEYNAGLKLYRVWSQQLYQSPDTAARYVARVEALNMNIGTPKVITLKANEVSQMAAQGQMGWVIQLGSFASKDNALSLRNKVKAAGFTGFVDLIHNAQGKAIYRMRVGPLMEKGDAERTKTEIQSKLKLNGLVKSHELSQLVE